MTVPPLERRLWISERQGLAERAQDRLVELILDGSLPPGTPLRISALADRLGVSATPIREALVHMTASGLVQRQNNKGFRVAARPTAEELDALFEARITLEGKIAALAARHVDDEVRAGLAEALDQQRAFGRATSPDDFRGFLRADRLFHARLSEAAHNRFLQAALDALDVHVQRYRSFSEMVVTDRVETLCEHQAIMDAVASADADAATAAMSRHLTNLRGRVAQEHRQR